MLRSMATGAVCAVTTAAMLLSDRLPIRSETSLMRPAPMGTWAVAQMGKSARSVRVPLHEAKLVPSLESVELALQGAKIFTSPEASPIQAGIVLLKNGKISKVGKLGEIRIPATARVINVSGLVVLAGFWNAHVHLYSPQWLQAESLPAARLTQRLESMLTRWGFTTVVDTGSILDNTNIIRRRIRSGEVLGPAIYTAGEPIYPKGGIPRSVRRM